MNIHVLYFDDCPNYESTLDLIERTLEELGTSAEVELIKVDTPESATGHRFLGSPTVRIDGVDIDPAARERTDYGLSCRRYGGTGTPSRDMVVAALKRQNGES